MARINEELEEFAQDILVKNDMYKIPVDLIGLANILNIEVYEQELENKISGAIRYNRDDKKYTILLNKKDNNNRKRFTLAHELGHFFLDKDLLESDEIHIDILYRCSDEKEKEIDYFSGALLMPKRLIEIMYEDNPSISELAEIFEVSESAMTVRLDILGLI